RARGHHHADRLRLFRFPPQARRDGLWRGGGCRPSREFRSLRRPAPVGGPPPDPDEQPCRAATARRGVPPGRRADDGVGKRGRAGHRARHGRHSRADSDGAGISVLEHRRFDGHRGGRSPAPDWKVPAMTLTLDSRQQSARDWFESLRTRICQQFEAIEREAGSDARFTFTPWDREAPGLPAGEGGGGVRGVMKGKVFEKVGVNVSTVGGAFAPEFARTIHGAEDNPAFFATGISLVAHMTNPHVPAVHMNTRFLVTTKRWFGGGADLNPALPYAEDTTDFHAAFKAACDAH